MTTLVYLHHILPNIYNINFVLHATQMIQPINHTICVALFLCSIMALSGVYTSVRTFRTLYGHGLKMRNQKKRLFVSLRVMYSLLGRVFRPLS